MSRRSFRTLPGGFVVLSILLVVAAIHAAPPAAAHAILESSSPTDQSVLQGSPARVVATFSEPVTLVPGSLRVFDAAGKRVDEGVAKHGVSDSDVVVGLKPDLPAGSYAVAWRVISADAHPVHGGWVFSVRTVGKTASLDSLLNQHSSPGYQVAGAVLRAVGYLGSFLLVGAAVFLAFVSRRDQADRRAMRGLLLVAWATILSQVLLLPVDAALATGEGLGSVFTSGVLGEVLGQGTLATLVGICLASVVALVAPALAKTAGRWAAGVSVALLTGAFVASGHTRSTDPTWLVSLVDAVHVAAGAVWFGGLVLLLRSIRTRRRADPPGDPVLAAEEVVGFSRLATVTIVAVGLAGLVLAYLEIRSWDGLFSTAYGRLVLAKFGVLVVIGAVAAFNHFRLVPALQKRPDRPARWRYLRRTIAAEAIGLVAVLGVTSALVNAVPARTAVASSAVYSGTAKLSSGSVNLVIDPARTGPVALHVYLLDAQGRPDDHQESVDLTLVQDELRIGPIDQELRKAGPGHYVTNGTLFTVPGQWTVTVQVRVDEFTENSAVLKVKIAD